MADYSSAFGYAAGRQNAPTVLEQGFRESLGQTYSTTPHQRCAGCPQVGVHGVIGTHYCNQNAASNPLAAEHRFPRRLIREAQNYISCQRWYLNGNKSDDPNYQINGIELNNFSTWYSWEIQTAGGNTLTLKIGGGLVDPRHVQTFFRQIPDPDSEQVPPPLIQVQYGGSWCMPGDVLMIGGNSVMAGRIETKITGVNYSGLSNPVQVGDTFTVIVESSVAGAGTKFDPNGGAGVATVYRKAYRTELWLPCDDEETPFYCRERILDVDCASWGEGGRPPFVELLNHADASTRIAWPLAEREGGSNLTATFKAEIQRGTAAWVPFDWRDRVECDGTNTRFYIGTLGAGGKTLAGALPSDASALRLTYYAKASGPTTEGTISYHLNRCRHSLALPPNVNVGGAFATGGGRYCELRGAIPEAVRNIWQPNCWLMGRCPYFEPALQGWVTADHFKQLWGLVGDFQRQKIAGIAGNQNLYIETGGGGGFLYLTGEKGFLNPAGYFPSVQFLDGKKFGGLEVIPNEDGLGNDVLLFHRGGIWNETYDYAGKRFPEDIEDGMKGLFPRHCTLVAKSQLSDAGGHTAENRPEWWHDVQAAAPIAKDPEHYGDGIVAGAGRDRIQRFNRTKRVFLPDLDKTKKGQAQGDHHTVTFLSAPVEFDGQAYDVEIQLKADGEQSFGAKYSGQVHRCIDAGNGNWIIEAQLHHYTVGEADGQGGDYTHDFFGSGGGIALPEPFRVVGHYQGQADQRLEPPCAKTMRGDTLLFTNTLTGLKFWVARAAPGAGDDLSADPTYGSFPNSRDYPGSDHAHLKRCDQYDLYDEYGVLAATAEDLAGASFVIATDGIIHPEATVEVRAAERGSAQGFQVIPGCRVLKASGKILIPAAALAFIQGDQVCFQVYCDLGLANRTRETPAELVETLVEHCEALDTVQVDGLIVGEGAVSLSADAVIGGTGFVCTWAPPEGSSEESYWMPSGGDHGYGGSTNYYQEIVPGKCGAAQSWGYAGQSDIFVGVESRVDEAGFGVTLCMPLWQLGWGGLLKRLPTGTTIVAAKIEVTLGGDSYFTKTVDYPAIFSVYNLNRYLWLNGWTSGTQRTVTTETAAPLRLMLLGLTNTDTWDQLGTFDVGTMEAGKRRVNDCADLITKMLALRDSPYKGIYATVASDEMPNPVLLQQNQQQAICEAMLKGWETVTVESVDGDQPYNRVVHLKRECKSFYGKDFSLGSLVITYRLPDGAISTMKIQRNYPSWSG